MLWSPGGVKRRIVDFGFCNVFHISKSRSGIVGTACEFWTGCLSTLSKFWPESVRYAGISTGRALSCTGAVVFGTLLLYTFAFPTARPAIGDALTAQQIKQTNLGAVGQFWAGVCIGTLPRLEAIPGRKFYDFDGITEKDPVKILGDAGVNALRVVTDRSQCLGPTQFVNNASTHDFEMNYELEFGCIDTKVKLAQRGVAQGMRVVHTINQGRRIPRELEHLNYAQMIDNVQAEARRQLQPFLDANVLPDIILLENEGTDGFLFEEASTGHFRGIKDDKASTSQIDQELCGHVPTGNINSYPQYAGYLKAEIMACNAVISTAGYDTDTVRYGLHSHAQYVQWKEGIVRGPDGPSEQVLQDSENRVCPAKEAPHVVPEDLLVQSVSQMLTIAGFSAYPDPQTPTNIDSDVARKATLDRLTNTLTQIQGYAEAIGTFDSGPFKGQYKLQSLGVEYATSFEEEEVPQEQALTELMWRTVKEFDSLLGIFWWEPWYCYNNYEGGKSSLCRRVKSESGRGEVPTDNLRSWGQGAVSPWKQNIINKQNA